MDAAIEEARQGMAEGGIPIGSVIVHEGRIIGRGHNRRVQRGSAIQHGEMDALENAGRQPALVYRRSVLYTTLSPCSMCSGAILLYGIPRVVVGENRTFRGEEDLLRARGVTVEVLQDEQCIRLMGEFIARHPGLWNEDIGVETTNRLDSSKRVSCRGEHMKTRHAMGAAAVLFLLWNATVIEAQWVMAGRAAKNRIERMTQKSSTGGYDVATVVLEAAPARVYDKAVKTLKATPDVTITKEDAKKGKIQFRKGQQVAGLQVSPRGEKETQLVIASSIADSTAGSATPLVLDAVLRICKEVKVECSVQPD